MVKALIKYAMFLIVFFAACPGFARTVRSVTILEAGLNKNPNDIGAAAVCKNFKPTLQQVKAYFSHAYPVENYLSTTERYSPCYATGQIEFSDNSGGNWTISSGGTGGITWDRGGDVHLFYKKYKWYDPFACTYGLTDEGEC